MAGSHSEEFSLFDFNAEAKYCFSKLDIDASESAINESYLQYSNEVLFLDFIFSVLPVSQEEINWAPNFLFSSRLSSIESDPSSKIEAKVKQFYTRLKQSKLSLVSQFSNAPNQKPKYGNVPSSKEAVQYYFCVCILCSIFIF